MEILRLLGYAVSLYLTLGVGFAVVMHLRGLRRIDHATIGSGVFFRILITPGLVALWPILLVRLARGGGVGSLETPVSARGLRRLHGLAISFIAVAIPVIAGAGIWNKTPTPDYEVVYMNPFPVSVTWKADEERIVRAEVVGQLTEPRLVYWSPSSSEETQSRVFLGAINGNGTYDFRLPSTNTNDAGSIMVYATTQGTWELAIDLEAGA